ncbi:1-deoxy-D-xylulose-5-phosphate synthase [Hujiaoplasma nucleasis]|uniref:1-deoxy-D-xylulose-5-phosphate synthase n=1 Tax=Hujiaoplasma nucleasis TaxID=2725268 RepID=A0A7L6N5G8_9MOLU|nr:1-deoxy-D-xylulose-5-phosphate synthase [Hujiaoplasma nucleasis]QLY39734.1 1-deoxy-D-xylulose-5-phosphate synthase [Hujiaoplasma nucleasis]
MNLLDIKDPQFLKDLSVKELNELSSDIRSFLIDEISKTGGHLASNLGVVELTIAIHKVFNSPIDRIVFDVGHQSYVHKILTGRAKDFSSLRQFNGLSGYQKVDESVHDHWEAGHSSTAISAISGFEVLRSEKNENYKNIAVVGDGSLNSGLSFEALNFLGHSKLKPIIILNDNDQSISKNVGRLNKILNKMRSSKFYAMAKKSRRRLPKFIYNLKVRTANMIRGFANNITIFDELGFSYYGPIDGHDMKTLLKFLEIAKNKNKPVVLHVVTTKGKGYKPAEEDQSGLWHGVGPFNKDTGLPIQKKEDNQASWSNIVSDYMMHYAKKHDDFKIIVPAMILGSGLSDFEETYPDKLIDVGICESFSVCFSAALSKDLQVFLPIYSSFLQRAYDQVVHDLTRQNLKIVMGIDRAGVVGGDGDTHQGIYDIAFLKHIPNIEIVQPSNAVEAWQLFDYAFHHAKHSIAIRYSRNSTKIYMNENYEPILKPLWKTYLNDGQYNLIAYGDNFVRMQKYIEENQLKINLYNALFIKPMDLDTLNLIIKSQLPTFVLEDVTKISGLGSSILEYLSDTDQSLKVKILALPDVFIEHGSQKEIYKKYQLDEESIIQTILQS